MLCYKLRRCGEVLRHFCPKGFSLYPTQCLPKNSIWRFSSQCYICYIPIAWSCGSVSWLRMLLISTAFRPNPNFGEAQESNFASVLARVRAGAEIIIENDARPVAVVRPAEPHVRLLSESLRLAREHGSTAVMDADFAKDVEAAIESHREALDPLAWD